LPLISTDCLPHQVRPDPHPPQLRALVASGPAPSARAHHSATLLGDTLYVLGGTGPHEAERRDVHALHLPNMQWYVPHTLGMPPPVLTRHTSTALNGALFVFGGSVRGPSGAGGRPGKLRYSSQLHTLAPATSAGTAASLPTTRGAGEKHLPVEGGDAPPLPQPIQQPIQQPMQQPMQQLAGRPATVRAQSARAHSMHTTVGHAAALGAPRPVSAHSHSGRAAGAGGANGTNDPLGRLLVWKAVETTGQRPAPRAEHGAAASAGKLFVFGGQRLSSARGSAAGAGGAARRTPLAAAAGAAAPTARASHDLFVLDPATMTWSQLARTPPLRREACAFVALGDRFLLAFGGWCGLSKGEEPSKTAPWSDALHALHLPTQQWFQMNAPGLRPSARYGHAAAVVDPAPTAAHYCTLAGEGLQSASAGNLAGFEITACDQRRMPKWAGDDP